MKCSNFWRSFISEYKKYLASMSAMFLLVTGSAIPAFALGDEPDPDPILQQPASPGECQAQYKGAGDYTVKVNDIVQHHPYYKWSCVDKVYMKDAQTGDLIGPPYTRTTEYMCFNNSGGAMAGFCQKRQSINDPDGRRPGNFDLSTNEYNATRHAFIVDKNGNPIYPTAPTFDPFDEAYQEGLVHPTFLRLLANDPRIKDAKREYEGNPDPVLNAHILCKHAGLTNTPPVVTSNYRSDEVEGQAFESDSEIAGVLDVVAAKIKLRMIDIEASSGNTAPS